MVTLKNNNQTVVIDSGEIISYQLNDYEYLHQKGSPGWGHTDTEMFPIIGPTENAGYRVQVPKGNAIQDQHGLLRELKYSLESNDDQSASFSKEYIAGTVIQNSKYPERSKVGRLIWPFSFRFEKRVVLLKDCLEITFVISGDKDMPYMLGYHPAFKLRSASAQVVSDDISYSLDEVMDAGNIALHVPQKESLILKDERELQLVTSGFGHFMLWSPVSNMICIEPITFYPYSVEQRFLHEGFKHLNQPEAEFKLRIIPKG
ncbi:MAG: aldose 1-epimerase [Flavobacteriaceae bacterium]|nr:aldose 1-epimerase [Muriicola sp.]MBT8290481.1 aldose 1-epimerase [Muriicola sp.]NNK20148.1 aldose 1-epimerase [Flavobacteriaceae bacterium]NNK35679.1 aldose 1-epimerase [Eudoraea sp.]NNL38521.1 aldose 1-epimerase [Flavobacteriaceae bacterium]